MLIVDRRTYHRNSGYTLVTLVYLFQIFVVNVHVGSLGKTILRKMIDMPIKLGGVDNMQRNLIKSNGMK